MDLYKEVRTMRVLQRAWRHVREKAQTSLSDDIKLETSKFDEDPYRNLLSIQRRLGRKTFEFSPQLGVLNKRPGKSPRPVVVAPLVNRIVQRAILDVLQNHVKSIRDILDIPSSVGGIEKRGTRYAVALVQKAIKNGARFYIRSDICNFFTKIPREKVVAFIEQSVSDEPFLKLFNKAIETNLSNLDGLGSARNLFPIEDDGVAQGSPLSPLMGNILLRDFDVQLNDRNIVCIRYIDDFIILGSKESSVRKAFRSALMMLNEFGMTAYDPTMHHEKASAGHVKKGFNFLGCHIQPGFVIPAKSARDALLLKIEGVLETGLEGMKKAALAEGPSVPRQRYVQTLEKVDRIIRGWGHSFAFCNGREPFKALDQKIDKRIAKFRDSALGLWKGQGPEVQRRIFGVQLLHDIKHRSWEGTEPDRTR